jgi:predicted Fe-Mo cluster-binding NifX family protein
MRVAVSTQGDGLESMVDPRFGRAKGFLLIDTDSGEVSALPNTQNLNAVQGAGIQSAKNIADAGVEAVISGNVGPKAFTTLNAAGIRVYLAADCTVGEAVESLKNGSLQEQSGANVESHWA